MKRSHLNLVLGLSVVALGVGAYVIDRNSHHVPQPLTALTPAALNKIRIEWPDSPAIELKKTGDTWFLTAPVSARADRFEVQAAAELASLKVAETLTADGIDYKKLGLSPANHSITLNDVVVAFGGVDPLESRRYVKIGKQVMLIDDPPSAALDKDYNDLIAKELFSESDPITGFQIGAVSAQLAADGTWTATGINAAQAAKIAANWQSSRAMWTEVAGKPQSGQKVSLTSKSGAVTEFIVAMTDPQFKLYSPALNISFVVSKALAEELLPSTQAVP